MPAPPPTDRPDRLQLFGKNYKVGERTGDVSYEMNAADLRENLRSIHNGKFFGSHEVQRLSKPFGTTMTIENGVGVIRVAAEQTGRNAN